MLSKAKLDNYSLFCEKAKSYGVCDVMSGDDKHKRLKMGEDEHSRIVYYAELRTNHMRIRYRSSYKIEISVRGDSKLNIPKKVSGFEYYSDIYPEDYDAFLKFASRKLGRNQVNSSRGINTPMKPKKTIKDKGDSVRYICGRCGTAFYESPRCPECGQLMLLQEGVT